jgi:hypothetical protein
VYIPIADTVPVGTRQADPEGSITSDPPSLPTPVAAITPGFVLCDTKLKEGCYKLNFLPKNFNPLMDFSSQGTLRVETVDSGIRFSGDLYTRQPMILRSLDLLNDRKARLLPQHDMLSHEGAVDAPGVIPIYSRAAYRSYLKGTVASLTGRRRLGSLCTFTLTFDEYVYQHPTTGFSGSFPSTPTRTLRCVFQHTAMADQYTGTVFNGTTELGMMSISWISPRFCRASLTIHTLEGAVQPPVSVPASGGAAGTEDFASVFATAGWDLSVNFGGEVPLPPSLVGVQDPNQCWSDQASARAWLG